MEARSCSLAALYRRQPLASGGLGFREAPETCSRVGRTSARQFPGREIVSPIRCESSIQTSGVLMCVSRAGAGRSVQVDLLHTAGTVAGVLAGRQEDCFLFGPVGGVEVWVCNSDGSNPVQLTSLWTGKPMGRDGPRMAGSIVFAVSRGRYQDIYVISANGGAPRRLTTEPAVDKWPCWSRDGQSIYFASHRSGTSEIWKMSATGGDAVQITRNERETCRRNHPTGNSSTTRRAILIRRRAACGECRSEEVKRPRCSTPSIARAIGPLGSRASTSSRSPTNRASSDIRFYEFATGKTRKILTIERDISDYIAVSPDGRTILYTQMDEAGSDLMLVENFR